MGSEKTTLKLKCCFCDFEISKCIKIIIGDFHNCPGCDSDIKAAKPKIDSNQCEIAEWKSRCH